MVASLARSDASGSPRSTAASIIVVMRSVKMPRRTWVGRTPARVIAAVGSDAPPGTVVSTSK
ncbi:MAG: hypothetical protein U0Q22_12915 [Acidimicrobiales bacterium]